MRLRSRKVSSVRCGEKVRKILKLFESELTSPATCELSFPFSSEIYENVEMFRIWQRNFQNSEFRVDELLVVGEANFYGENIQTAWLRLKQTSRRVRKVLSRALIASRGVMIKFIIYCRAGKRRRKKENFSHKFMNFKVVRLFFLGCSLAHFEVLFHAEIKLKSFLRCSNRWLRRDRRRAQEKRVKDIPIMARETSEGENFPRFVIIKRKKRRNLQINGNSKGIMTNFHVFDTVRVRYVHRTWELCIGCGKTCEKLVWKLFLEIFV